MKIGAQLYTIRLFTQTVKDFEHSIKKIANIGYKSVQLSALGQEVTFDIAGEICKEYGLEVALTHCDSNRILHDTDRLLAEHKKMNCKYIGIGAMPEKYRTEDWIHRFIEDYKEPAKKIREEGMKLMYHNHDFEFEKINGTHMINYLLEGFTPEEMGITLDSYWVHHAGGDVVSWIETCKDRISCVHLKDIAMTNKQPVMAPVMEGNMNFKSIMNALENSCCEYALVEQDICLESPFTCLEKSYKNLKSLGYK